MKLLEIVKDTIREYLDNEEDKILNHKKRQLNIILSANPMQDDYHTGIRKLDDIKMLEEFIVDDITTTTPDFTIEDINNAINSDKIIIYSSYPIKDGVFVTPSRMEAKNYAGNGKVYGLATSPYNIAWITPIEGVFAKQNYE